MSAFLHISGSDLIYSAYTAVIRNKEEDNEWVVQNIFSKYNIDNETALSSEFGAYMVFFERIDKSFMSDNEVKLLNHKMENQSEG